MEKNEFKEIVKESHSKSDIVKKMGYHTNGVGFKKVNKLIKEYDIDVSHFDNGASKHHKYERIVKVCPICDKEFEALKGHKREKITCSHSCSNTHFRSGEDNPNWKEFDNISSGSHFSKKYRRLCFSGHEHKCVICGEDKMLDVHHFDENRENNTVENLIPICATHHNYVHSGKYRHEVMDKIIEYRNSFINANVV